ncbi:MAG: GntR family transcriptional regulator [Rhizobiaceae bacterium]
MKKNAKQRSADDLKRKVLSMVIAPGQALDETQLSAEYGISRTPLREVIQRLGGEGYLTLEENRGAKVASLDLTTLRHFFQSAPMIYASVARLAAEQAAAADIALLKDIQRAFRLSMTQRQSSETAAHNHRFHEAIGEIASSPYLMPSLNRLLIDHTRIGHMFYRSNSDSDRRRIEEAAEQHDAMIEAFANHDPAAAVELTLQHWELSRGQMERFVSPDPLPFDMEGYADAV